MVSYSSNYPDRSSNAPRKRESDRRQASGRSRLVNVSPNAFFERTRDEIDLANQARAILIIDQRRSTAAGIKMDLGAGEPLLDDCREFRSADAPAAAIVGKMREFGFERQANQL